MSVIDKMLIGFQAHRNPEVWGKSVTPELEKTLHSGILRLSSGSQDTGSRFFHLTQTHLYMCETADPSSPCKSQLSILWTELYPFQEFKDGVIRFGFSLIYGQEKQDFYTQNEEDLTQWLDVLEEVCILRDIRDDYDIVRELGAGGQSQVFLAFSKRTGLQYAIKQFSKKHLNQAQKRIEALVQEIETLRLLDHPRILKLHRVYEDEKTICLVTEYVSGGTLYQSLSTGGTFSSEESETFVTNFLDVLAYLAGRNILHRDLKPENIMIPSSSHRGDFKLIDFGFATTWKGTPLHDSCGSAGYMAPELIKTREHDESVDVYSAGIVLYVSIVGFSPFFSRDRKEVLRLNARNKVSFDERWEGIQERFIQLIRDMTAAKSQRIKTAAQLKTEFEKGKSDDTQECES